MALSQTYKQIGESVTCSLGDAVPGSRNCEFFDLLFDFVNEIGGAGAVDDSMIEGEREGDNFRGFVFRAVRNQFAMSAADK